MTSSLSSTQAQGRTQAVRPVERQKVEQAPARTTHADPDPSSSWQSVSALQKRQASEKSLRSARKERSAQKGAFPVVSIQRQLLGSEPHPSGASDAQRVVSGKQVPLLWATHVDVAGSQM